MAREIDYKENLAAKTVMGTSHPKIPEGVVDSTEPDTTTPVQTVDNNDAHIYMQLGRTEHALKTKDYKGCIDAATNAIALLDKKHSKDPPLSLNHNTFIDAGQIDPRLAAAYFQRAQASEILGTQRKPEEQRKLYTSALNDFKMSLKLNGEEHKAEGLTLEDVKHATQRVKQLTKSLNSPTPLKPKH